ncbi:MAG TPA: 16S rRNA (adenine(1518)-N(6)/adenine(1519)-N(6))-dimethyltransferase RsmA [bacterium]|nr:16S rRNA (adenine(1518)-N(6)/adenine(1519)-N(6))-dimethyltransferase RsmA [bacterium]
MKVKDIKTLMHLLNLNGPKKRFGQNFLLDESALNDIVKAADLKKDDQVLEIGPGLGVLSMKLAPAVEKLVLVELDRDLAGFLRVQFANNEAVTVCEEDALQADWEKYFEGQYKIVANIPYNITGMLFRKISLLLKKPERVVLLVQKEVAERLISKSGDMNVLALVMQFLYKIKIVRKVSRMGFYPAPKVDSAVILLERRFDYEQQWQSYGLENKDFFQLVKIGFSAKRKKLSNNLANGYHKSADWAQKLMDKAELADNTRAEDVAMEDWLRMGAGMS